MPLSTYGPCGPLGFPLSEKQCRNLDTLLKALPKSKEFEYGKTVFTKAPTELNLGERSDVSWISTETHDRYDHIVIAKGMDDIARRGPVNPLGLNHVRNEYLSPATQRVQLDLIQQLNRESLDRAGQAPLVEGAIESFELAFRMQEAVPRVMDLSTESRETLALYGIGSELTDGFGRQCLLARRFAEAGVRFIELGHGTWDQHINLREAMAKNAGNTDKPIAGLIADLKRRGMLQDTLILWGGEFGRTPHSPDGDGRDHNHKGYAMWMAGGGVKGGFSYGATDEHGYEAVENKMHIHDWHATILHLLGLDHERLTFRHASREMRLTDVSGAVATEILA